MNVNLVVICGRVGKLEFKELSNSKLLKMSVAVNKSRKDKEGNWQQETEWVNVSVWGDLAERANTNLEKGHFVHVQGELKTNVWEKDGKKNYSTGVNAQQVKWLPKTTGGGGVEFKTVDNNADYTTDDIPF